jgi:hypothetical protein
MYIENHNEKLTIQYELSYLRIDILTALIVFNVF